VEQLDIDLTPTPRGRPWTYTREEAQWKKRDYYKRYYYTISNEACLKRLRRSPVHNKVVAQQAQVV